MVKLSREFLLEIENNIKVFKDCPIIVLEHNNDYCSSGIKYRCGSCGAVANVKLPTHTPVQPEVLLCPVCNSKKYMAHINLNLN